MTICAAWCSAAPPICIERAPPWPLPLFTVARVGLDDSGTRRSAGRAGRRRSADSWSRGPGRSTACRAPARPCRPARSGSRRPRSGVPREVSRKQATPSPRSLPRAAASARRAAKPPVTAAAPRRRRDWRRTARNRSSCRAPLRYGKRRIRLRRRSSIGIEPQPARGARRSAARSGSWPRACRRRDRRRSARCW